jgi:hypothetical protein
LITNASIQTPVITPIVNDNIIRDSGATEKNSNAVIIRHNITANNDTIIIKLLFFIFPEVITEIELIFPIF